MNTPMHSPKCRSREQMPAPHVCVLPCDSEASRGSSYAHLPSQCARGASPLTGGGNGGLECKLKDAPAETGKGL